jgi:ATP-binding cassette subfamily F protein uup
MNLLTLQNVSKQYAERLLLDGVDLMINEGERIGLIGVNGSGKSTLLRIIAGEEGPDSGSVTVWGGVRIEYLHQDPELNESATVLDQLFRSDSPQMQLLRNFEWVTAQIQKYPTDAALQARLIELSAEMERTNGWAAEANDKAILTRLGIEAFDAPVSILSGGQRKRVAMARALIDRADLLILDEPTNHIDAETVAWLEEYLITTPGALLMVTHDRYFLDRVVNRIVELDRRQLITYPGNYSQYLELRQERHERLAADEQKRRKLLKRELEWVRRAPAARSTKQKARKDRVEELQKIAYDSGEETVSMALATQRLGSQVLSVKGLTKSFGDTTVVDHVDFVLEPGERIGLLGPNGAGKSTFLDLLAGKLDPDAGTVVWGETVQLGYYDQESADLAGDKRLIDFIEEEAPLIRTRDGERIEAAQMLEWFLFPRPMQWGQIDSLSGGERRRLYLLRTLVHRPNVLLLDEPTNDLDIQTLTVLEEFLDHFSGSLIVVSHDRYFLDRTVDFIIPFENGKPGKRYPSPYETYRRLKEADATAGDQSPPASSGGKSTNSSASSSRPRDGSPRLTWREERELAQLEAQIETSELEIAEIQEAINASGADYERMQTLADKLQLLEASLERAMERWAELAERAQ